MKIKIKLLLLFLLLFICRSYSQWPGYLYAFQLVDDSGNNIDSSNYNYTMKTIRCPDCKEILLYIKMCDDNKNWKFYGGGNHELSSTNKLEITRLGDGITAETMTIVFPPPLTVGEHPYYADLYVGVLKFKKGTYTIRLPKDAGDWEALKELKICQQAGINITFLDISGYQK